MTALTRFLISLAVGFLFFAERVALDALYLHLHRHETSWPPYAAVYFSGQRWLWFVIPALLMMAAGMLLDDRRTSSGKGDS